MASMRRLLVLSFEFGGSEVGRAHLIERVGQLYPLSLVSVRQLGHEYAGILLALTSDRVWQMMGYFEDCLMLDDVYQLSLWGKATEVTDRACYAVVMMAAPLSAAYVRMPFDRETAEFKYLERRAADELNE